MYEFLLLFYVLVLRTDQPIAYGVWQNEKQGLANFKNYQVTTLFAGRTALLVLFLSEMDYREACSGVMLTATTLKRRRQLSSRK